MKLVAIAPYKQVTIHIVSGGTLNADYQGILDLSTDRGHFREALQHLAKAGNLYARNIANAALEGGE